MYLGGSVMAALDMVATTTCNGLFDFSSIAKRSVRVMRTINHNFNIILPHTHRHGGVFCGARQDGWQNPRILVDSSRRLRCQKASRAFCCWVQLCWFLRVRRASARKLTPLQQQKNSSLWNRNRSRSNPFTQASSSNRTLGQAVTPVPFAPLRQGGN